MHGVESQMEKVMNLPGARKLLSTGAQHFGHREKKISQWDQKKLSVDQNIFVRDYKRAQNFKPA